jgi:hypothetical protein
MQPAITRRPRRASALVVHDDHHSDCSGVIFDNRIPRGLPPPRPVDRSVMRVPDPVGVLGFAKLTPLAQWTKRSTRCGNVAIKPRPHSTLCAATSPLMATQPPNCVPHPSHPDPLQA